MKTSTCMLTIGQRGVITLPKEIREVYQLKDGDQLVLTDFGGAMLLKPGRSDIDELADRIGQNLKDKDLSLEKVMMIAREEREKYGKRTPHIR